MNEEHGVIEFSAYTPGCAESNTGQVEITVRTDGGASLPNLLEVFRQFCVHLGFDLESVEKVKWVQTPKTRLYDHEDDGA